MTNTYAWGADKSETLRRERGFGFEDVVTAIEAKGVLDDISHSNPAYPHQRIMFVDLRGYVIVVPYVMDGETKFLKTAFPDRKATRKYLNR